MKYSKIANLNGNRCRMPYILHCTLHFPNMSLWRRNNIQILYKKLQRTIAFPSPILINVQLGYTLRPWKTWGFIVQAIFSHIYHWPKLRNIWPLEVLIELEVQWHISCRHRFRTPQYSLTYGKPQWPKYVFRTKRQ